MSHLGARPIWSLTGELVYVPLVWWSADFPRHLFAQSIIRDGGIPLEYWIQQGGRDVILFGDEELLRRPVSFGTVYGAMEHANVIERELWSKQVEPTPAPGRMPPTDLAAVRRQA